MRVTFVGAARTVTGSCTLLETSGKKILIDCGLPQGNDEKVLGLQLPFDPASIDYVFLTHAHIDHSGRIPLLVRKGFKGQIYATDATVDLCSIMLSDSAHIQEMENEWLNRKKLRAGEKLVEPLYEVKDAQRAMELFVGFSYDQRIKVTDNIDIEFTDAGHLLGSAYVQIWATEGTERRHLVFSGDIGNLDQPLINDPAMIKEADFVVVESTYGDRNHKQSKYASQKEATEGRSKQLAEIIKETFDKGGNVIIPSFAVGRTQELLYLLRNIINHNLLPEIPYLPVFLDSPLAIEATKIFSKNIHGYFDDEAMKLVEEGHNPLIFDSLTATVSADESKELNFRKESCVIISSSGMCEAGRIKHHLKHNLWRKESSIVFSGYQSSGTLGRSIVDGAKQVTIFSEKIDVKASIKVLEGISGHADQQGLIRWLEGFTTKKPRHIFVNHGDEQVARYFAGLLASKYGFKAYAPMVRESFDLLYDELPVSEKARKWILGINQLKVALQHLDKSLDAFNEVVSRFKEHAKKIFEDPIKEDPERLGDAVERFAQQIEKLYNDFNDNEKGK
ncbi:MAG: MBL fold metallo-hydrolase RNA specificity domain-containing protein [Sphaerochaetaceae bacterium]|jgi:metallo-beta-lactamase family protein